MTAAVNALLTALLLGRSAYTITCVEKSPEYFFLGVINCVFSVCTLSLVISDNRLYRPN